MSYTTDYVKQSIIDEIINMCIGCRSYEIMKKTMSYYFRSACTSGAKSIPICDRRVLHAEGICPCSICLIKMMCQTKCEKFDAYINSERKDLK